MVKIRSSFEKHKNGILVHMECIDKGDYLSTDIIPPDSSIIMKNVLYTKVSFMAKDIKQAKQIIDGKNEAIDNFVISWRNVNNSLPADKIHTI